MDIDCSDLKRDIKEFREATIPLKNLVRTYGKTIEVLLSRIGIGTANMATDCKLAEQLDRFPMSERPTLIVMSVAHSGSTPIAKALALCGWLYADRNHHYDRRAEVSRVAILNTLIIEHVRGTADDRVPPLNELRSVMLAELADIPDGFVIKDPRWCITLAETAELVQDHCGPDPVLVWLQRKPAFVNHSFFRRNQTVDRNGKREPGEFGYTSDEMLAMCRRRFDEWPGRKIQIQFEDVLAAVGNGSRSAFLQALGIEQFGVFASESVELAMSLFDPGIDETRKRAWSSGWDAQGKFWQND